jgi:hypothetical protein
MRLAVATSKRRHGCRAAALVGLIATIATLVFSVSGATGAVFTTVNTTADGSGHCFNGTGNINCNIYDSKDHVWLNGGPAAGGLDNGTYFFVILDPGGQRDPNDGSAENLSDDFDTYLNRTFSVSGATNTTAGTISYTGHTGETAHDLNSNKLRVAPYADTSNPGGVYILAICAYDPGAYDPVTNPVTPRDCKYDAFKVKPPTQTTPTPPSIVKDASPSFSRSFAWTIVKNASATRVDALGSANITYTVDVTPTGHADAYKVTGTITVSNDNSFAIPIVGIGDVIKHGNPLTADGNASCLVGAISDGATTYSLPFDLAAGGSVNADYTCTYSGAPADTSETNIASVTWDDVAAADGHDALAGDTATFSLPFTFPAHPSLKDECVDVTDEYTAPNVTPPTKLATLCVDEDGLLQTPTNVNSTYSNGNPVSVVRLPVASPTFFRLTYTRSLAATAGQCVEYDNTGTFTSTDDEDVTGSDDAQVTVCGPGLTGALTIGFWKTTNGQNLVKSYCSKNGSNLGTYLAGLGGANNGPFSNAPTSCNSLASYVYGILNGASATNMNKMLKAQMLGTALDVWFSGPGWTSNVCTGCPKPPSKFLTHNLLGTFNMITTAICPMIDNLNTGTATCKNNTPSTDAVAAGALPNSPMSMQAILDYAATTPTPFNGSTSTSVWYSGDRTKQEILKNVFDQFNNRDAFGSFL